MAFWALTIVRNAYVYRFDVKCVAFSHKYWNVIYGLEVRMDTASPELHAKNT
jgi:hypothetical protein